MEIIYDNVKIFFDAICLHIKDHNDQVVSYDDPKKILIGYKCLNTNSIFYIRLSSLNKDLHRDNILRTFISNKNKRNLIVNILNISSSYDNFLLNLNKYNMLVCCW